jgi:hypothetical protein
MKAAVMDLAREADKALGQDLLIAYNGATGLFSCSKRPTKKRDNIHEDPFPQTVCIQAPLLHLEECQLTIVLAPRCLYVAGINVAWLFLNQHCHIRITPVSFLEPFLIQYCYIEVTTFSFRAFFLIEYCHIKIIIFNFDTESSWNKRGMFSGLVF